MSDAINVGNRISTLDVSRQFDSYSKVVIHVSDDTVIEVGTDAGRTFEINSPFGTQQMAQDILTRLQGYQYQPYQADGTLINPAAEMGDAISSQKVYGGIYTRSTTFGRLMKSDVGAPCDEEINHEYQYETPTEREFKRQIDDVRASLIIANNRIDATVTQTGGDPSSFGWSLTASGFDLYSNGQTVMSVDQDGLTVAGNVGAVTGTIGGFNIGANAIYKTIDHYGGGNSTGVYLGTDGIQLGQGFRVNSSGAVTASNLSITGGSISIGSNFSVNSSGNVSANNVSLTGTLSLGGVSISAADLVNRANSAYTSTSSGGYCYSGTAAWNRAQTTSSNISYFRATTIFADGTLYCRGLNIADSTVVRRSMRVVTDVQVKGTGLVSKVTYGTIYYYGV